MTCFLLLGAQLKAGKLVSSRPEMDMQVDDFPKKAWPST